MDSRMGNPREADHVEKQFESRVRASLEDVYRAGADRVGRVSLSAKNLALSEEHRAAVERGDSLVEDMVTGQFRIIPKEVDPIAEKAPRSTLVALDLASTVLDIELTAMTGLTREQRAAKAAHHESLHSRFAPDLVAASTRMIAGAMRGDKVVLTGLGAVETAIGKTFELVVHGWSGTPAMNVSPGQIGEVIAVFSNFLREDPDYDLRMGSWLRDIADQAIAVVDEPSAGE